MVECRVVVCAVTCVSCLILQIISLVSPGWIYENAGIFTGFWMNCTVLKDSNLNCELLNNYHLWLDADLRRYTLMVIAMEATAVLMFVMATIASWCMYCEEKSQRAAHVTICCNIMAGTTIAAGQAVFALKIAAGNFNQLFICFYLSTFVGLWALVNGVVMTCLTCRCRKTHAYKM